MRWWGAGLGAGDVWRMTDLGAGLGWPGGRRHWVGDRPRGRPGGRLRLEEVRPGSRPRLAWRPTNSALSYCLDASSSSSMHIP